MLPFPCTAFQAKVYQVVMSIPRGRVMSYAKVAELAQAGCAQAVGQAMRRNPDNAIVPCHRVVCADGSLGGYFGSRDNQAKKARLIAEGVVFMGERVALQSFVI